MCADQFSKTATNHRQNSFSASILYSGVFYQIRSVICVDYFSCAALTCVWIYVILLSWISTMCFKCQFLLLSKWIYCLITRGLFKNFRYIVSVKFQMSDTATINNMVLVFAFTKQWSLIRTAVVSKLVIEFSSLTSRVITDKCFYHPDLI